MVRCNYKRKVNVKLHNDSYLNLNLKYEIENKTLKINSSKLHIELFKLKFSSGKFRVKYSYSEL